MFNYDNLQLIKLSIHELDHSEKAQLILSNSPLEHINCQVKDLLIQYFIGSVKTKPDYEKLTFSNGDFTLNPLFNFCNSIFTENDLFHNISRSVAQHLFQVSTHPNIKSGYLCVALFDNILIDDEIIQGVGFFKSESEDEFLQIVNSGHGYSVVSELGIAINKLDKACLVLNVRSDDGYVVSIVDRANNGKEAQYWRKDFVNSIVQNDAYHQTQSYMNLAQTYISHKITEEFEIERPEQMDLLNKSINFFKQESKFDETEFKEYIFNDPAVIRSFEVYRDDYKDQTETFLKSNFGISKAAVKKSAKDFKSVLKLDKNFHIYIHGDKNKIERGTDDMGRKYYKLYFESES